MNRTIESGHIEAAPIPQLLAGAGSRGLSEEDVEAEALRETATERGDAGCQATSALLYRFGEVFVTRREEAPICLPRNQPAARASHPCILSDGTLSKTLVCRTRTLTTPPLEPSGTAGKETNPAPLAEPGLLKTAWAF